MGKKVSFDIFQKSQFALIEYMKLKEENKYIHKANVNVLCNGNILRSQICDVIPKIETNNSIIEIVGDDEFNNDYYLEYTNEYQVFKFINGVLYIECIDRHENPIKIAISNV